MRRPVVALLSGAGLLLTAVSVGIDLTDTEPRAQLWVGAAAGAAFLAAVPFVRAGEAQTLATRARLLIGAGVAAVLAVFGLWQATEQSRPQVLLLLVPAALLFVAAAIGIREAERSRTAVRLGQLRARLDGQEIERRRWARELHDQTLQDLAAIEVRLAGLAAELAARTAQPGGDAVIGGLESTRAMTRDQIRTLRHLITQMRPLALDTLGLAEALRDLAARAEDAAGVEVRCEIGALPADLEPEAEVSIYRIVQEAVTNALKHAACHRITVTAGMVAGDLDVTVTDDGIGLEGAGPPPAGRGLGTAGMRERADVVGATLAWVTPPGGGTRVVLHLRHAPAERGKPARRLRRTTLVAGLDHGTRSGE